jgi:hypothetical protein
LSCLAVFIYRFWCRRNYWNLILAFVRQTSWCHYQ